MDCSWAKGGSLSQVCSVVVMMEVPWLAEVDFRSLFEQRYLIADNAPRDHFVPLFRAA